jgi:hypothetical protein
LTSGAFAPYKSIKKLRQKESQKGKAVSSKTLKKKDE